MKLLVIRHARAESVKEFAQTGVNDELRPLTGDGRERMRLIAVGLHRLVEEIDVLATSPLARARQTADIVAAEFDAPQVVEIVALRPQTPLVELADWLQEAGSRETIAVIGHNMHLSELVGWLQTGKPKPIVEIKKGGAVMLELRTRGSQRRRPWKARLLWSLTPRQLRMLGATPSLPEASTHP